MKKTLTSFCLCLTAAALCSVSALAADRPDAQQLSGTLTEGHPEITAPAEKPQDPAGTLSFENLDDRMLKGNKNVLVLSENIAAVEAVDYDKLSKDLKDQMNDLVDLIWMNNAYVHDSYTGATLQQAYEGVKKAYDGLKDGETQKDNADRVKMMENAQNQVIMAGESLYVALQDLNRTEDELERQLAALDRTAEEMQLRYDLGQISALQLQQVMTGRTQMQSGLDTLRMNIKTCNMQMQMMVGNPRSESLALQELPKVSDEQIAAMDLDRDLQSAKQESYQLLDAQNKLDDAREKFEDDGDKYHHNKNKYEYVAAEHVWQAAQYQHQATVETFEANFHSLYLQVKDYQQIRNAAQAALELEKNNNLVSHTKYGQGNISYNDLLAADDKLKTAENDLISAEVNLFSSYNNYRWAVEYGILN